MKPCNKLFPNSPKKRLLRPGTLLKECPGSNNVNIIITSGGQQIAMLSLLRWGSGSGSIIFSTDPDPDLYPAHFLHPSTFPLHLIFQPSSLTPLSSYLNSPPSYLIRLPSSLNTAPSPLFPHHSPFIPSPSSFIHIPHLTRTPSPHISHPSSLIPHLSSLIPHPFFLISQPSSLTPSP